MESIDKRVETLENRVGQPGSEHPKSLFEIVEALNRELLELRLKIEELESRRKKSYEQGQNQRND